jgi:hypothetical protein
MKWYKILQQSMAVFLLSTISSCALPKADPSLTGQTYLNEQTQDRMEFTKKGTVVITWSSDEGIRAGDYLFGYPKDYPHEFSYAVYDDGHKFTVLYLTSTQTLRFPYLTMEISDSKGMIIVTRKDGRKELFMRIAHATEPAHTK